MSHKKIRRKTLPPDLQRPRPGAEPYNDQWMAWCDEMSAYFGYTVCGSKGKRHDHPCPQAPMENRTRCYHHGGKALRGPQHPGWVHGQASMFRELLPQRAAEVFEAAMQDPERLSLSTDLALAVVAQHQELQALQNGHDPAAALRAAQEHIRDLRMALAEGDQGKLGSVVDALATTLEQGVTTAAVLDRIGDISERKLKLAYTERKRLEALKTSMSAEEVRARDQMLTHVVLKAARDRIPQEYRAQFLRDFMEGILALSGGTLPPVQHATPTIAPVGHGAPLSAHPANPAHSHAPARKGQTTPNAQNPAAADPVDSRTRTRTSAQELGGPNVRLVE